MSLLHLPVFLNWAKASRASIDSSLASPMKPQVFTMRPSASSSFTTAWAPASFRMPSISSESTRFLGQPRLTRHIFWGAGLDIEGYFTLNRAALARQTLLFGSCVGLRGITVFLPAQRGL